MTGHDLQAPTPRYRRVPRVPGYPRSVRATQVNTITQVVKLLQGMLENSKEDAANDKESWYGAWECVFLPGCNREATKDQKSFCIQNVLLMAGIQLTNSSILSYFSIKGVGFPIVRGLQRNKYRLL